MFQLILLKINASRISWSWPSEADVIFTCCTRGPHAIFFSVPRFGFRIFLLIFIFHFENLSKFIIFPNEDVRRIEPQTNNHKSSTEPIDQRGRSSQTSDFNP